MAQRCLTENVPVSINPPFQEATMQHNTEIMAEYHRADLLAEAERYRRFAAPRSPRPRRGSRVFSALVRATPRAAR
jgi:hypothetical protein